jgi:two-component system chemotaxis response regulator CheB
MPFASRGPVRALVACDPGTPTTTVTALLAADTELQLAAAPLSSDAAPRAAARLRPDVVVVLLGSPDGSGIASIGRIMAESPVPIVACAIGDGERARTIGAAALRAGALAALDLESGAALLVQSIKNMAAVKVVRRRAPRETSAVPTAPAALTAPAPTTQPPLSSTARRRIEVVAIGSSTGGPQTLEQILTRLPVTYPLPVLVVQHIDPSFTQSLVSWLRPLCALPVSVAGAGQPLDRPGIVFAPPDRHLSVRGRTLVLTDGPPICGHRPSANTLFDSLARECGPTAAGVLLTGMGEDGAAGLRSMKDAGAVTVAQNEETSIVYGMPRAAVALGAATHVLGPKEIADLLCHF